jgi:hypothetical protein
MEETARKNDGQAEGRVGHAPSPLWITAGVPCLLLIYVLSVGPACKLKAKGVIDMQVIQTVYAPLVFLSKKSKTVEALLDWYVQKLWNAQ